MLFAKITPCIQNGNHAIAQGLANGFGFGTTEFHVKSQAIPWVPNGYILSCVCHGC